MQNQKEAPSAANNMDMSWGKKGRAEIENELYLTVILLIYIFGFHWRLYVYCITKKINVITYSMKLKNTFVADTKIKLMINQNYNALPLIRFVN